MSIRSRFFVGLAALAAGAVTPLYGARPLAVAGTPSQEPGMHVFVDVDVAPMYDEVLLRGQDVLVTAGRITAVAPSGTLEIPEGTHRIEGGGVLTPGLIDAHVHIFEAAELPLYIANGVTTVRNMFGWDLHLELRKRKTEGDPWAPRILTAGAPLDGEDPRLPGMLSITTPEEAREAVAAQAREGYDAIKVYDGLTPKTYGAAVLAARRHGLPVVGHVPEAVGLDNVLMAGQSTIEHLAGYPGNPFYGAPVDSTRPGAIAKLAAATRRSQVWHVPTLAVLEALDMSAAESEAFLARPELRYVPEGTRRFCCSTPYDPADDLSPEVRRDRRAALRSILRQLRMAGVRIALGTDNGNRFVPPAFSVHTELRLLVDAGLTPYEAIRSGTADAAGALGLDAELGTVEVGKVADLLLLKRNPLEDVGAFRDLTGVMNAGRWIGEDAIAETLEASAAAGGR